jgi:L-amino acid N-acyltransferase YncA
MSRIRCAQQNDLSTIASIHVASWKDAYAGIVPRRVIESQNIEKSLAGWKKTFNNHPNNITVAENKSGELVGFCCAGVANNVEEAATWEVYGLHVQPKLRGKGIGTQLLHEALNKARAEGHKKAIVWTLEDLLLSRKFYEKRGAYLSHSKKWHTVPNMLEVAYCWDLD